MITKQNVSSSVVVIGHLLLSGGDNNRNLLRDGRGPHRLPCGSAESIRFPGNIIPVSTDKVNEKPPLDKEGGGGYNEHRKGAAGRWWAPLVTRSNRQQWRAKRLLLVVIYLYNQAQQVDDNQAKRK